MNQFAFLAALGASLAFSFMGAGVRLLEGRIPPLEMVFFRNCIGLCYLLPSLYFFPVKQAGGALSLLIFRGIIGTAALFFLFVNLNLSSLAVATTFVQTAPLLIALTSWIFLKERLKLFSYTAVFIGFLGVVVLMSPGGNISVWSSVFGMLSSICTALAYTAVASLRNHYEARSIILSFCISGTLLPLFLHFSGHIPYLHTYPQFMAQIRFVPPGVQESLILLGIGITALIGQYLITFSYSKAKAGLIATIGYTQIIFSLLIGILLGDPYPGTLEWLGMGLIVTGGILVQFENKNSSGQNSE